MSHSPEHLMVRHLYFDHSYTIEQISKITLIREPLIKQIIEMGDGYEQRFA
jgi:hypothetical protein